MTVAESLEGLKSAFNPAAAAGLNKTIQLNITGDDAGIYSIRVANQECELLSESVAKPDLTLTTSDQNWVAITQGKLDPMNAFLAGKVKASGDMMLAMRIPQLFKLK
ncbi:SCP-2 sterol transfer family protein [Ktedonobacteria bacterium brp13]|nr:SCP-2 sterol transfer family protein [Ktedonobacteria bacterium brp13]